MVQWYATNSSLRAEGAQAVAANYRIPDLKGEGMPTAHVGAILAGKEHRGGVMAIRR
jgi:hypothetical protein